MTKTDLVERIRGNGGFARAAEAERAIRVTLEALGPALLPNERRSVSEHLPREFRGVLEVPTHLSELDLETFYGRVARHERVSEGRAREHAQVVCQALSETLPWEVVAGLRKHLPRLAALFESPEATSPPTEPERVDRHDGIVDPQPRHSIAEGRPGGSHPLSSAHPDRAHSQSVVRSDNPHGDTKLSSSHGLTQERERETLATGRPGSKRP